MSLGVMMLVTMMAMAIDGDDDDDDNDGRTSSYPESGFFPTHVFIVQFSVLILVCAQLDMDAGTSLL